MKKTVSILLIMCMFLALALTGCGQEEKAPGENAEADNSAVKVGFVYVGPASDGGWTTSHDVARKQLENNLNIDTLYKESVPEGPECEKVINDLIDQGCNVIFSTSFGFMDYTLNAAKAHPDVKFMHCSGYMTNENMGAYFGRIYQARYLSGIAAGMKTKTDKIGYVAAYEIPEVLRGINAFTLGVRSVNPDATVHVKWTHTWIDAAKAKDAAVALLAEDCDVITQHQDAPGPQIAAEEKGVWSIGYNMDMKDVAPKAYITAPVWNWGPYYEKQVKAIMDGTWKAENYWGGMEDGIVDLAPLTENAPEGAKEAIEKVKAEIIDGSFKVFSGPIKGQAGEIRVAEGETLTDEELTSMDWFVEGVVGNPKQ